METGSLTVGVKITSSTATTIRANDGKEKDTDIDRGTVNLTSPNGRAHRIHASVFASGTQTGGRKGKGAR
jgi:hypothetical protein